MTRLYAKHALLPDGWQDYVRIDIEDGRMQSVHLGKAAPEPGIGDQALEIVIPGLVNAHSHAFQRLIAGYTEQRGPDDRDNFWSWRERMYCLAQNLDADILETIARLAYTEMLERGYTSVVEFHYLHCRPDGQPNAEMFRALQSAATDAGIRLTYMPVLYQRGGFRDEPLDEAQQRFGLSLEEYFAHYDLARDEAGRLTTVGLGVHSLRAVSEKSLAAVAERAMADEVPMHLHIAEQRREVGQCLAAHDRRPVRWLMERHELNERWCLVHATHMDADEVQALAASGAVVCLCPSTEANLGDGLFPLAAYLEAGGRFAIGSDSHVSINPYEELRWLEYGQRLAGERRNIAAIGERHTGYGLYTRALRGGQLAAGVAGGRIEPGAPADLVVLDGETPAIAAHRPSTLLDALVFSGHALPIRQVMIDGEWQVTNGRHDKQHFARKQFRRHAELLLDKGVLA